MCPLAAQSAGHHRYMVCLLLGVCMLASYCWCFLPRGLTCWMISSGPCPLLLMSRSTRLTRSKCTPPEQQQQQHERQQGQQQQQQRHWSTCSVISVCKQHPVQTQYHHPTVRLLWHNASAGSFDTCLSIWECLLYVHPYERLIARAMFNRSCRVCLTHCVNTCMLTLSSHIWSHSLTCDAHSQVKQWLEPLTECVDALNDDHPAFWDLQ